MLYRGDPPGATSTSALFARVHGELNQRGSRRVGCQHGRHKVDPGDFCLAPQIDSLRVDAGQSPVRALPTEQMPGVITDRVGMVLVHMVQDLRFRRCKRTDITGESQVRAFDPLNLTEAGNKLAASDGSSVETKIAKPRVNLACRVTRVEPRETTWIIDRFDPPDQRETWSGQRIGITLGGVDE